MILAGDTSINLKFLLPKVDAQFDRKLTNLHFSVSFRTSQIYFTATFGFTDLRF